MTKAELDAYLAALIDDFGPWDRECDCPTCKAMVAITDHIAALEAQLAQRDERIRKVAAVVSEFGCYGPCEHGSCVEERNCEECKLDFDMWCLGCRIQEEVFAADRLLADAKEGEGK